MYWRGSGRSPDHQPPVHASRFRRLRNPRNGPGSLTDTSRPRGRTMETIEFGNGAGPTTTPVLPRGLVPTPTTEYHAFREEKALLTGQLRHAPLATVPAPP